MGRVLLSAVVLAAGLLLVLDERRRPWDRTSPSYRGVGRKTVVGGWIAVVAGAVMLLIAVVRLF